MNQNDIEWAEKVRRFPLLLIYFVNVMVCVFIFVQIFLYYDAYVYSPESVLKAVNSSEVQALYVGAIEKILTSFALWSFVLLSVNLGTSIFIRKTKMLVMKLENELKTKSQ